MISQLRFSHAGFSQVNLLRSERIAGVESEEVSVTNSITGKMQFCRTQSSTWITDVIATRLTTLTETSSLSTPAIRSDSKQIDLTKARSGETRAGFFYG